MLAKPALEDIGFDIDGVARGTLADGIGIDIAAPATPCIGA
jgi:hypothetical protein